MARHERFQDMKTWPIQDEEVRPRECLEARAELASAARTGTEFAEFGVEQFNPFAATPPGEA